jgi:cobyrinic acid a,c-diamide synthase
MAVYMHIWNFRQAEASVQEFKAGPDYITRPCLKKTRVSDVA